MHDVKPDLPAIITAAHALEAGALVAFPTETVYGLGADAENPAAVAKIYAAKGRPQIIRSSYIWRPKRMSATGPKRYRPRRTS
jgi:tRNA A37 threonylcarbamoyladenosine synthetase subunit TsaC/SUA5/YrdC